MIIEISKKIQLSVKIYSVINCRLVFLVQIKSLSTNLIKTKTPTYPVDQNFK